MLACSRTWVGDGGGTVSGLAVDAEISSANTGTDVGGVLLSPDVIILGWGACSRPEAAGAAVPG